HTTTAVSDTFFGTHRWRHWLSIGAPENNRLLTAIAIRFCLISHNSFYPYPRLFHPAIGIFICFTTFFFFFCTIFCTHFRAIVYSSRPTVLLLDIHFAWAFLLTFLAYFTSSSHHLPLCCIRSVSSL
ncbi:unnamed protein product, partial [Sphacelaria rigidula]